MGALPPKATITLHQTDAGTINSFELRQREGGLLTLRREGDVAYRRTHQSLDARGAPVGPVETETPPPNHTRDRNPMAQEIAYAQMRFIAESHPQATFVVIDDRTGRSQPSTLDDVERRVINAELKQHLWPAKLEELSNLSETLNRTIQASVKDDRQIDEREYKNIMRQAGRKVNLPPKGGPGL